jgi:hypothetical protein
MDSGFSLIGAPPLLHRDEPDERRLARARWAVRAQFAALGLTGGAWRAHMPSLKARYGVDERGLALLLLAVAAGALLSLLFAGRMVGWLGVRPAVRVAVLGMAGGLAMALHWPGWVVLLPALVLFGAAMSLLDVAINAEGTVLERLGGRPVMSGLHGMFSLGGMAGAALVAVLFRLDWAPGLQLPVVAAGVAALALMAAPGLLDTHPPEADDGASDAAHFAWPRGLLLVIGLLIFAGMTAEGVMYDWSVLYLKDGLGLAQDRAALGYVLGGDGGGTFRWRCAAGAPRRGGAAARQCRAGCGGDGRRAAGRASSGGPARLRAGRCRAGAGRADPLQRGDARARCQSRRSDRRGVVDRLRGLPARPTADRPDCACGIAARRDGRDRHRGQRAGLAGRASGR